VGDGCIGNTSKGFVGAALFWVIRGLAFVAYRPPELAFAPMRSRRVISRTVVAPAEEDDRRLIPDDDDMVGTRRGEEKPRSCLGGNHHAGL
jgi:hypothetical protein